MKISQIIKDMRYTCTEEGLKSEPALEWLKYFNVWWDADSWVDQSECKWSTHIQSLQGWLRAVLRKPW